MSNSKFNDLSSKARDLVTQVGDGLRDKVPDKAVKWIETGAALGVVKTGGRVAVKFVRRNPVVAVAAAAGAGLLWYAAKRRAQNAEQRPIDGSATRVDARRISDTDTDDARPQRARRASRGNTRGGRRGGSRGARGDAPASE